MSSKTANRLAVSVAVLMLLFIALSCSLLHPGPSLTWHITVEVDPAAADREAAVRDSVPVIQARLNRYGIANFKVQSDSDKGRIVVNLPEVQDRPRLKELITAEGRLEIVHVISPPSPAPAQTYATEDEAMASLGGKAPANRRLLPYLPQDQGTIRGPGDVEKSRRWVVVESPPVVAGNELRDASAVPSAFSKRDYQIAFSLRPAGAEKFSAWTGANTNEYLGVALNSEVKSIAYIKSQISDSGEISGRFTKQSAEDLAQVLISGPLPARVKIIEEGSN